MGSAVEGRLTSPKGSIIERFFSLTNLLIGWAPPPPAVDQYISSPPIQKPAEQGRFFQQSSTRNVFWSLANSFERTPLSSLV